METYIQNQTADYSIDLNSLNVVIDSVVFRLYKGNAKNTIAKFMYPETEGFYEVTEAAGVYSFTVPSEITDVNEGTFGWEIEITTDDSKIIKAQAEGLQINKKAKDAPVES